MRLKRRSSSRRASSSSSRGGWQGGRDVLGAKKGGGVEGVGWGG